MGFARPVLSTAEGLNPSYKDFVMPARIAGIQLRRMRKKDFSLRPKWHFFVFFAVKSLFGCGFAALGASCFWW
jgi:hypothetical protein